jgi:CelD/BcsL family acetyltransferase involved in cellulose biosynthesis
LNSRKLLPQHCFSRPHLPDRHLQPYPLLTMYIQRITDWAELEPFAAKWDQLAGDIVFRSWAWQSTWWKHYGQHRQLFVLLVFSDPPPSCQTEANCNDIVSKCNDLVAILPCYLETSFPRGRALRLIGDGEVCSDHLDLLAEPTDVCLTTQAIAQHLCENSLDWDTAEFSAIGSESRGLNQLADTLKAVDCHVVRSPNENCWLITLPENWEAFLAMQSKSHRKQLRRLEKRVLNTDQAVWHLIETAAQFEVAWPILVDLHQRRRNSLGEPGCFASKQWAGFHRELARLLLDSGKLRLSWLELAGQSVAAEYHFANQDTTWAYQGGVDPDRIDEEPGRLSMIRTFQHAITEGHQQFDLLRGDEAYKAHWRAEPQATFDLQIVPDRSAARWRSQACSFLQRTVRFARQITNILS